MDAPPTTRRWFQWRLSTWFVLVAIIGWAMIQTPYLVPPFPRLTSWMILGRGLNSDAVLIGHLIPDRKINPDLLGPCVALLAFLTWKAFWLVREHARPMVETSR